MCRVRLERIKIWSYGGGENNKQQPLPGCDWGERLTDSHSSLGRHMTNTHSPVSFFSRNKSVHTPSLYISIYSRRRVMRIFFSRTETSVSGCHHSDLSSADITVVSPRYWPWVGEEAPDTRKQRSLCLGCHPDIQCPEESLSGQSDPASDGHTLNPRPQRHLVIRNVTIVIAETWRPHINGVKFQHFH